MYNSGMPSAVEIIRRRQRRRLSRTGGAVAKARRSGFALVTVFSMALSLAAILAVVGYGDLTRDLPSLDQLPMLLDPENGLYAEPTVITDRSGGAILATLGYRVDGVNYLPLAEGGLPQLAPELLNAVIVAVDPGFWQNPGFYTSTLFETEPDTIPLRLVSDLLFWREPAGVRRALREKIVAAQLVRMAGREQVLEWYLNSANFGHQAFGAEAGARLYFGKSAARLSLAEAAALATVALAPDLNPFDAPDLVLARRNELLQRMLAFGYITETEAVDALSASLGARSASTPEITANDAFLEQVRSELVPQIPLDILARGGLTIVTTLDLDLQAALACTLETQLQRIAGDRVALIEGCAAARLLPTLPDSQQIIPGAAAEGVILDPRTGQILALAAGHESEGPQSAAGAHPPGSLLSPYVYLAAFTRGFGPASLVWDIPASLPDGVPGSPNLDGGFHGPLRIRTALAGDYLAPALQLLDQIGPAAVWNAAALAGLPALAGESSSLLLEGGSLSVIDAAHAFSAFSTQGVLIGYPEEDSPLSPTPLRTTSVLRVVDAGGRVWLDFGTPQARPVMSAPLAFALTHILSDEAARWPALGHPNALEVGRPAGVKTGFTQDRQNAWSVGYTPQIAVGIWLGTPSGSAAGMEPEAAAGIWHAALKFAVEDLPSDGWVTPPGIVELDVCDPSGLLPTQDCPVVVREIFLSGSEPVQADTLYRRIQINRETGLLATVFTPPALIEERVFLVPPPEALAWAQQAGLDVPPETYDLVSQPPQVSPDAQISSPMMFAYAGGVVAVRGTAAGDGFESYTVQVGQGLNPQQWLQLAEPAAAPVVDGELAVWDTAGLNGLYAVRLQVVRAGSLLETHVIQVTIDNRPPELSVLYPQVGQTFLYPQDASLTVQLAASDDLALAEVSVYLDGRLLRTFSQPPFALSLDLLPGAHTLRVTATDLAGNRTELDQVLEVLR